MDFWKAILGLIRRRYVVIPVMILSIGVAALAYLLTPSHYVSSTTMVLTTPTSGGTLSQDPSKPTGLTNPLLNFDDGLKTTSSILIQAMNTPDVLKELTAGGSAEVIIDDGSSNANLLGVNGPFVFIEADSKQADEARAIVQRAQQRVRDELLNRQKALNAPPTTYITIVDVVPPSVPEVQSGLRVQFAVAGLVVTVIGGIAGAYAAQRMFAARRRRPTPEPAPPPLPPRPVDRDQNAVEPATVRFTQVPHPSNGSSAPVKTPAPANSNGVDAPLPKPIRTR